MLAGIYNIYFGFIALIVGVVFCIIKISRYKKINDKTEKRKVQILLILIMLNIPIALTILFVAISIETVYSVEVTNTSTKIVDNCVIDGGGVSTILGKLSPGEKITKTFWIKNDGTLYLKYEIDNQKKEITIDGYVTNSMGGNQKIKIP